MFADRIGPVITDFGLVRIMQTTTQTATGLVSGTPAYISPEQAQGLRSDHRTDIYSLGVVLYELLSGRVPFEAETNWTVIYKHIHEAPPPIPHLQPATQAVLDRALAKDPDERYQTCRELAMDYIKAVGLSAEAPTLEFSRAFAPVSTGQVKPGVAFEESVPVDQVILTTTGMPLPPEGSQYEAWLIQESVELRVSVGLMQFDAGNRGSLTYVDPQGRNLLGMYHGLEITNEPAPDNNPIPSSSVSYLVMLPSDGFVHVRHLLYSFNATPGQVGFIHGLNTDTTLLQQLARDMLDAYQSGDEGKVRSLAEAMINVIAGMQSPEYKDWDSNGAISDPSDGFGLLLNGDNEGYIQGTYTHANLSGTSSDATENMKVHGEQTSRPLSPISPNGHPPCATS